MAEKVGSGRGSVVRVDNSIDWERKLRYKENHSVWEIFRYLYWGIYIFAVGCILIIAGYTSANLVVFGGWAAILLAVFVILYGFVMSLHHKLMRKHG